MKYNKLNISNPSLSQPDPYIIEEEGVYYIYVSGFDGVGVYKSVDLVNWLHLGYALQTGGQKKFWAPSVLKYNNQFYMYYSSLDLNSDDDHNQKLKVAVGDNPEGPFNYLCDLGKPFSIDPHIVLYKGDFYVFYASNVYEGIRVGTQIFLDKMISPTEVEGKQVRVLEPTIDEEIYQRDRFKKGEHWHTLEGPFYFNKNGIHYLMYSGNSYRNDSYFVGYAIADGDVQDLRDLVFKKYPNDYEYHPILSKNEICQGTGHNSVIKTKGKYYIVYHGRFYNRIDRLNDDRKLFINELIVNKENLTVK